MKLKKINRNDSAIAIAVLAALVVVAAPMAALFAIWQEDLRWLYSGGALLLLAIALYFIATQLFDDTPEVTKK